MDDVKDEMGGVIIEKAIFLGGKRYGYYYFDSNNRKIERSVYAGVERNSLTFLQIKKLYYKQFKNPLKNLW